MPDAVARLRVAPNLVRDEPARDGATSASEASAGMRGRHRRERDEDGGRDQARVVPEPTFRRLKALSASK